jgi:C4-dicarboxylate-specific signal transduction histidine kinase
VVAQAERAAELVDQILDFSRRAKADRKPLRLDSLLRDVFGWLSDTLPKNVRPHLTIAEGEYSVLADPAQLQQLVTNLALNARDAMPRGGPSHEMKAQVCLLCRPAPRTRASTARPVVVRPSAWSAASSARARSVAS